MTNLQLSTVKQHISFALSSAVVIASAVAVITCNTIGPPKNLQKQSGLSHETGPSDVSEKATIPKNTDSLQFDPRAESSPTFFTSGARESTPVRWTPPTTDGKTPEGNAVPILPRFYDSLARLEAGQANDHVRIVWLGGSHTQADEWTHTVRTALQSRFGNGGPGFIHVGWTTNGYRRKGVGLKSIGYWALTPITLVSVSRVDDGVFGLGGLRVEPRGADCSASVVVDANDLPGRGYWDFAMRFSEPDSALTMQIDDNPLSLVADAESVGAVQHIRLESTGPGGTLRVGGTSNRPQLLGVVVESAHKPGVVLDTLGLNGARYRTALAWDESAWISELERRQPDLAVFVFGTNESNDRNPNYAAHENNVKLLMERVAKASPKADCLVIGPVDRGGVRYEKIVTRLNEAQAAAAQHLGCAFWSGQVAMGGPGGMQKWVSMKPRQGSPDRIHLTLLGYRKLGGMLARDLMSGYDSGTVVDK